MFSRLRGLRDGSRLAAITQTCCCVGGVEPLARRDPLGTNEVLFRPPDTAL